MEQVNKEIADLVRFLKGAVNSETRKLLNMFYIEALLLAHCFPMNICLRNMRF